MSVALRLGSTALTTSATADNITIIGPSTGVVNGDLYIACIYGNNNLAVTAEAGWNLLLELNNTSAMRGTIFWKIVETGDPGSGHVFTKSADDNLLMAGFIVVYSGCDGTTPIDSGTPSTSANASSDTISYADFNPAESSAYVLAVAFYAENTTNPGTVSGTNPTFAEDADAETGVGADCSIFVNSGSSDGSATGSRTQASNAAVDNINIGVLFGLKAAGTIHTVSASISAAATVVASLVLTAVAVASIAASGSVTAAAVAEYAAASSIAGSATVEAALTLESGGTTHEVAASIQGAGTVTANAVTEYAAQASVAGSGAVTAAASVDRLASAQIVASGSVEAAPVATYAVSASVQGSATVTADLTLEAAGGTTHEVAAQIAGAGTVSANAVATYSLVATVHGSAFVSAVEASSPVPQPGPSIPLDAPSSETFQGVVPDFISESVDASSVVTFQGVVPDFAVYDLGP